METKFAVVVVALLLSCCISDSSIGLVGWVDADGEPVPVFPFTPNGRAGPDVYAFVDDEERVWEVNLGTGKLTPWRNVFPLYTDSSCQGELTDYFVSEYPPGFVFIMEGLHGAWRPTNDSAILQQCPPFTLYRGDGDVSCNELDERYCGVIGTLRKGLVPESEIPPEISYTAPFRPALL